MADNNSVATKLNVNGDRGDALDRFCALYNSRAGGKSALLNDLLAGGLILKETGLLDLVLNIDLDSGYRASANTDKTRRLIKELSELFGNLQPIQSPPPPLVVETKQKPEPEKPKVILPDFGG